MKLYNRKSIPASIFLYICASALLIFTLFPFVWAILISFREKNEIFSIPPKLFSSHFTLDNYRYALEQSSVLLFSFNSVIVAVFTVILTILFSVMGAYSLSRLKFKGKGLVYALLAVTQIFPMVIIIIPLYMMFRTLKLYNTLTSLVIVYTAISVPIALVMMLGYLRDLPEALEDSAKIDGCSRLQTMLSIMLPLARPGIVATAIYVFITIWQEYLIGISLIGKTSKYTLTVGLSTFRGQHSTEWGALMATSVIIAVPAMIAFMSVQKYFIDNLAGSIKG